MSGCLVLVPTRRVGMSKRRAAASERFAPLELGWKARSQAETALMAELVPMLKKQAGGREISGQAAYE